jgi:hypothetical protein
MTAPTVTTDLVVDLVVAGGPALAVTSRFEFRQNDPYAVGLHYLVDGEQDGDASHGGQHGGHWVTWTFARELLEEGITSPAGDGDVQIWPGVREGARCAYLHTRSPHGAATFVLALPSVVEFLLSTYALVPSGTESDFLDLDAEIASLRT